MKCKVKAAIAKYGMPVMNSTVIAAVSGGADSMALVNVLNELKDEYNMRIIVCHVNHSIRGEQADNDELFVKEQCIKMGLEVRTLKADVPALAKKYGLGEEECGRKVRYDFFSSIDKNALIATAHTLSDKCETLILNETRGTSVRGLCSIPAIRGNIIRPLIDCTRSEIENYCKDKSIEYVTDKTNFDDSYSRNRIRLNVIPQLKKINPSFEKAVYRLTQSAAADDDYFSSLVTDIISKSKTEYGYNTAQFINEHSAVRYRVISEIISKETGLDAELVHIRNVDSILSGGKTEIIGNTIIQVNNSVMRINPKAEELCEWQCEMNLPSCITPAGKFSACIFNRNELSSTQIVHNKVIDFDSISGTAIIRNRRAGDKMKIAGSSCTKTLKKLFNEKHLENRNSLMIIADDEGIVWTENLGCDDRCKITDKTKNILLIGEES